MNKRNATYNALNMRGLKKLPPPVYRLTGITTTPWDTAIAPLLHQASASCGRVLCVCHTDIAENAEILITKTIQL